jgi:ADP-ribosylglycohydrolase
MLKVLGMPGKNFLDKIRGSMVGAVVGDCLGSPVECQFWEGIPVPDVLDKFSGYRALACKQKIELIQYTDDTAMVLFS